MYGMPGGIFDESNGVVRYSAGISAECCLGLASVTKLTYEEDNARSDWQEGQPFVIVSAGRVGNAAGTSFTLRDAGIRRPGNAGGDVWLCQWIPSAPTMPSRRTAGISQGACRRQNWVGGVHVPM